MQRNVVPACTSDTPVIGPSVSRALHLVTYFLAVVSVAFIFQVLERCRHGLDVTDEGYYLNSISNPLIYKFSLTQFGSVYHPIYRLLGNDVVLLRQANVLITFCLAFAIVFMVGRQGRRWRGDGASRDAAVAICLGLPSLLYLLHWLPSPGYNVLALQGLLIVVVGLVASLPMMSPERGFWGAGSIISGGLIGFGGFLVFLAKPSSAILLAAVTPLVTVATSRRPAYTLLLAGVTALSFLILLAFALDGSLFNFVDRYRIGMEFARDITGSSSMWQLFRLESLGTTSAERFLFGCIAIAALVALAGSIPLRLLGTLFAIVWGGAMGIFCALLIAMPDVFILLPQTKHTTAVLLAAVPLAITVLSIANGRRHLISRVGAGPIALCGLLIVCPYIFAFGTGNHVTHQAMMALVFWGMVGGVIARQFLVPEVFHLAGLLIATVAIPTTIVLVGTSMESPYRLNSALRRQTVPVAIGAGQTTQLLVDADTALYLGRLRPVLEEGGGHNGVPVLDMTGGHPGALFAIGAKAIGLAWMIGGYPGSENLAHRAISYVPCDELARTWLLVSPQGARALPRSVLDRVSISIPIEQWTSIVKPGQDAEQFLVKPNSDTTSVTAQCEDMRMRRDSVDPIQSRLPPRVDGDGQAATPQP